MKLSFGLVLSITILSIQACQDGSDQRCLRCYANVCLKCQGSFTNQNGICNIPNVDIPNCLFYSANQVCSQCQYGYSPSANGDTCIKISQAGCLALDSNNRCKMCNNTFQLDPVTNACSSTVKCKIPGCAACGFKYGEESCFYCGKGWTIFTTFNYISTCIPSYPALYNCKKAYYNDPTKCLECHVGFYVVNNRCRNSTLQTQRELNINLNNANILTAGMFAVLGLLLRNF